MAKDTREILADFKEAIDMILEEARGERDWYVVIGACEAVQDQSEGGQDGQTERNNPENHGAD